MDEYSQLLDSLKGESLRDVAKAVIVVWEDIWDHSDTWVDYPLTDEDMAPLFMRTMGYLVQANDKVIVVASTVDVDHDIMSQVTVLPRGCIKSLTVL